MGRVTAQPSSPHHLAAQTAGYSLILSCQAPFHLLTVCFAVRGCDRILVLLPAWTQLVLLSATVPNCIVSLHTHTHTHTHTLYSIVSGEVQVHTPSIDR